MSTASHIALEVHQCEPRQDILRVSVRGWWLGLSYCSEGGENGGYQAAGGGDRRRTGDRPGNRPVTGGAGIRAGGQLPQGSRGGRIRVPGGRAPGVARARWRFVPMSPTSRKGGACSRRPMRTSGRIDVWVNNAGVAPSSGSDLLETTPESWDRVLATNLRGPFFLTQAVASTMIAQPSSSQIPEPQIIFITSISSTFASVYRAEYCVAKAGLAWSPSSSPSGWREPGSASMRSGPV